MKLSEIIEKQRELNQVIGAYPKTHDQLAMAIIEECGEVSRALRYKWRWWSWDGQEDQGDRAALIEELVDVFKFLLVGIISSDNKDIVEGAADIWSDWELAPNGSATDYISFLIGSACGGYMEECLEYFVEIASLLGVSRAEIEAAYLAKWEKNMQRCGEGGAA